jgi:cell division protein ZapE
MKPSIIYQQHTNNKMFTASPAQLDVIQLLDAYYDHFQHTKNSNLRAGIYLWGTVGSGKTMLLDIFYNELPNNNKQRMHFHEFINQIHSELKTITGKKDPLTVITKKFAKTTKFLFLDEFIVSDISNAVILKNLLLALIKHGVFIMTSSNTKPHNLYHDGINRELFLPAIAFIETNFTIAKLDSDTDYRNLNAMNNNNYFHPITQQTELIMLQQFECLHQTTDDIVKPYITVCNRNIAVIKATRTSAWFEFENIIMPPRSYPDYLYLASNFKHIFISNVRPIHANEINLIYNFCHLIDICYDKGIRLILSATCTLADIFKYHQESKTILRTKSRLIAMQKF